MLVHDRENQWIGGEAFATVADVRKRLADRGSLPRLVRVTRDEAWRVCQLAMDLGTVTCIFDELDMLCSQKKWKHEIAHEAFHYGRHRQVDIWGAFRATRNVHEDIPLLVDFVFLFRHSPIATSDLIRVKQRWGEMVRDELVKMSDHECLIWHKHKTQLGQ